MGCLNACGVLFEEGSKQIRREKRSLERKMHVELGERQ